MRRPGPGAIVALQVQESALGQKARLTVIALAACGKELPENNGGIAPESDGSSGAGSIPTEATPTPDRVVPTVEPTSTPRPTLTPVPDYAAMYRDDVVAAVTRYLDARNDHDQAALDRAMTASSAGGLQTIEQYQSDSFAARGWSDFPLITIKEVSHIRCDEILCKLSYVMHSVPPGDGTGRNAPFYADDSTGSG